MIAIGLCGGGYVHQLDDKLAKKGIERFVFVHGDGVQGTRTTPTRSTTLLSKSSARRRTPCMATFSEHAATPFDTILRHLGGGRRHELCTIFLGSVS